MSYLRDENGIVIGSSISVGGGSNIIRRTFNRSELYVPLGEQGIIPLRAPSGVSATFTRATTTRCPDFEDVPGTKTKWNTLSAGEVPIWGARRVQNLIPASGTGSASLAVAANKTMTLAAGRYVFSMGAGTGTATFSGTGGATGTLTANATNRTFATFDLTAGTFIVTASVATLVDLMCELITGQANQNPSEYVSIGVVAAPYHGFGIDGVKNFLTTNGNTVAGSVVTAGVGTAITHKGYLPFPAATQLVTPTAAIRDMTDASWVKVTMTPTLVATGIGGHANVATRLTANGANSTILQTLVAAASSRTYSAFVKRVTGTGAIEITQDGGATWTAITSQINSNSYTRIRLTASVLNASYGFRIATSGDAIDVDFNQFEAGSIATPPIDTAGGTRNADVLSYNFTVSNTQGSAYCEYTPFIAAISTPNYIYVGGALNELLYSTATTRPSSSNDGTNTANGPTLSAVVAGTTYKVAMSYSDSVKNNIASGSAGTQGAYDGSWNGTGTVAIGVNGAHTNYAQGGIKNIYLWNTVAVPYSTFQVMTT